jgi:hypothetical protein
MGKRPLATRELKQIGGAPNMDVSEEEYFSHAAFDESVGIP